MVDGQSLTAYYMQMHIIIYVDSLWDATVINAKQFKGLIVRSENHEDFELEEFVPYIVSTLSRQFATLLEKSLKQKGLSISNWRVLLCLSKHRNRTLNEIVEYTLLPQSSLSRSINRMEERGFIIRSKRRNDHRTYDIKITKFGRNTLEDTVQDVKLMCEEPLTILEPEERENWLTTTNKIINHFGSK